MPKVVFETIEDYYSYFVMILGMSENMFWNADLSFLKTVYLNKCAYDNFVTYIQQEGR